MEQGKVCTKCVEFKVYDDFNKMKRMKDGHQSKCRQCEKKYQQENKERLNEISRQYYQENKEKMVEKMKQYEQENKEKLVKYRKQYQQENKESIKEYQKQYRKENADRLREQKKLYLQSDKGKEIKYISNMKRRSYKMKVSFTPHERKEILERDNYTCQCCGITVHDYSTGDWNTPNKANIDHIVPISKGGNSEPSNLHVLCRNCNISKKDKIELVNT